LEAYTRNWHNAQYDHSMPEAAEAKKLSTTSPHAASEARAQALAAESIFAPTPIELGPGEVYLLPPHPDFGMLDDDATERYEELLFERDEEYLREPDIIIPEQHLLDPATGQPNGIVVPGDTQRGRLKQPYRKLDENGKVVRVSPPYSVQLAKAVVGDEDYAKLKAAGKSAADIWRIWGEQALEARERADVDDKSDGSAVGVEAVPETDGERPVEVSPAEAE
jgi:hypothetical protein